MNTGEPFGLPPGTVRGIIALGFTAVTLYLFAVGGEVNEALLGISTLIIGNYFGYRGAQAPAPSQEVVDAPYIPGESNG
jgi:hypothetical protein